MNTISREYSFAAAHRLEGHPKCGRLHGHNYLVTVHVTDMPDERTGMVVDYGNLDTIVKPVIDAFDHRYIVSFDNTKLMDPYAKIALIHGDSVVPGIPFSTAECLSEHFAKILFSRIEEMWGRIKVLTVNVKESAKSDASYTVKLA